MVALKNPFGERNGKIVVIDDLTYEEKGLNCRCVCPNCGGEFEARLGNIRIHHFAHSKGGCDEETAILNGLYKLFKQYLDEKNYLFIPAINLYCNLGLVERIDENNFDKYVNINNNAYSNKVIKYSDDMCFVPDDSEIVYKDEKPVAIICSKGSKQVAVVIQHPQIGCNTHYVRSFNNLPSIKLDMFTADDYELKDTDSLYKMFGDNDLYFWLANKTAISKLDEINEINSLMFKERLEREKQAKEEQNERIYEQAMFDFNSGEIERIIKATKRFETIRDWKNSSEMVDICNAIIYETEAEKLKLIDNEKQERKRKKELEEIKKTENRERKFAPLQLVMTDYYERKELDNLEFSNKGYLEFIQRFSDSKNVLGVLEAEACLKKDLPLTDHWGQVWKVCSNCGQLFKYLTDKGEIVLGCCETLCSDCNCRKDFLL